MSGLLFASVHDTLLELLSDAKYLGAKPGIIAMLHTWSPTLILPPPIHCLVTGGGRHESGHWVAVRNGFLLPMRVVIRQGLAQGTLQLPAGQSQPQLEHLLNKRGRQKWNVHLRERSPYGQGVLIYRARSLRGGLSASQRLVSGDGQRVVLRYEERAKGPGGQATQRPMCLPIEQCMGRFWRHVPPGRAVLVRGWGLYAHTHAAALAYGRQQWGQDAVEGPGPEDGQSEAARAASLLPVRRQRRSQTRGISHGSLGQR